MARAILAMGEPGTGKSRGILGLNPKRTVIIKPNAKELPFRGASKSYKLGLNMFHIQTLAGVGEMLEKVNKLAFVDNVIIEDLTHYWSKRQVDEINIKGFDKWNALAADIKKYIIDKESILRPNLNIIIIAHVEHNMDSSGNNVITLQTPGKLTDKIIKIPSFFTYIFHTVVDRNPEGEGMRYRFLTNKDGMREAKTPEGMFPMYIENNYQQVIDGIEKYQLEEEIKPLGLTLEQKAELEKAELAKKQQEAATGPTHEPEEAKATEQVQAEEQPAEPAPAIPGTIPQTN